MSSKRKSYYDLDDVGKIGITSERSTKEIRQDAAEMSTIIQAYKLGQASVIKGSTSSTKRRNQPISNLKSKTVKGTHRPSKKHVSRRSSVASR